MSSRQFISTSPTTTTHDNRHSPSDLTNDQVEMDYSEMIDYEIFLAEAQAEEDALNASSPPNTRSSTQTFSPAVEIDNDDNYSRKSLNKSIFYLIDEYELVEAGSQYYNKSMTRGQILPPLEEGGPIWFLPTYRPTRQGSSQSQSTSTSGQGEYQIQIQGQGQGQGQAFGQNSNQTKDNLRAEYKGTADEDGDITPKATPRELKPKVTTTVNKVESSLKRCNAFVDLPSLATVSVAV